MLYSRIKDLVSIIITNYNHADYVSECLDSIKNQTYKNIEIIIVDDASTDNSMKIINNWIKKNEQNLSSKNSITCISLPRNSGFAGAVSIGFFLSKGEFIACQDSDDLSHPNRIEKQIDFLKKHPEIQIVGTNYSTFENDNFNPKPIKNWLKYGANNIKKLYSEGGHCVSHGTILFYGKLFDKFGGLTRKLKGAEDYEFITKLLSFGVDNLSDVLYYYRIHDEQRSHEFYDEKSLNIDLSNIRVLLVLDSMNIGGTETHVLTLASELLRLGIHVAILSDKGALYEDFEKLGCNIYNMNFPLSIIKSESNSLKYKNKIKNIIIKENVNIIHAHQSPSGSLCIDVAKELNIPCIFTVHGLYYQDIASTKLNNSTKIISVSEPVFDWLHEFNVQSIVIPNGIDFKNFYPKKSTYIREKFQISKNSFVVLYASRLAWGKVAVCENVIRVCRDLRNRENIDIYAFIIGNGPGFNNIKNTADRINSSFNKKFIYLMGETTNMIDFYSNCDCVVGTGRVALEALACGKPLIATGNQGYFGLLNKGNFEEAWKVYFGDHKSIKNNNAYFLYEDLKSICQNRESLESVGSDGYEWSKNIFDIKETTKNIIKLYKLAMKEVFYNKNIIYGG
ncbi:glycosyltransferase [Clostridium sp. P21]|uniref:Glycosyltransferase n=1 Tax=Clostridium muellerianum TaxID=2716538 RepID=A0A7Y0EKZ0_9CLOT|nr:glycosyltransferase [Clostridium muellerianum]NMM65332.1 glycosyltransferase [Clostridium muellerianum]